MDNNYLAYLKYAGESVQDGYLDLRKSAEALNGIDEVFRFFLYKRIPELAQHDFEIPVAIRKGSWETLIPDNIVEWLQLVLGTGASTYSITALKKMAEHDFKDIGFKTIVKQVVKAIKWVISISKHIGTTEKKTFDKVEFKEVDGIMFIGIKNQDGVLLFIPKIYLDLFVEMPPSIFAKIVKPIENDRTFLMDFSDNEKNDPDDPGEVQITYNDKAIFYRIEEPDDILFPELVHGQYVELEGHVSRGNEKSNTIGFEYAKHILMCLPEKGNITKDKDKLFTNCIIKGYVDRIDKTGNYIEKKPRIRYTELIQLQSFNDPQLRFNS